MNSTESWKHNIGKVSSGGFHDGKLREEKHMPKQKVYQKISCSLPTPLNWTLIERFKHQRKPLQHVLLWYRLGKTVDGGGQAMHMEWQTPNRTCEFLLGLADYPIVYFSHQFHIHFESSHFKGMSIQIANNTWLLPCYFVFKTTVNIVFNFEKK